MSSGNEILKIVPTMQALALAGENYKFAKKRKKKTGDFIKMAAFDTVGAALINETAKFTGGSY